ncbi:response regulator [Opitutaceae bacterium TAV4]|nr:response regulator [Opitutaceae bacterium TAV4]
MVSWSRRKRDVPPPPPPPGGGGGGRCRWLSAITALSLVLSWPAPGSAAMAAAGLPVIAYTEAAELSVEGPVWALARADDGRMFAGASQLLAGENGRWQTIDVPGAYGFRGLAPGVLASGTLPPGGADGRMYVGAVDELGYVEPDATGALRFTSLKARLRAVRPAGPGEIWKVQATPSGIVFAGAQAVFRWDGQRFAVWELPARPRLLSFGVGDDLWFYQSGVGVLRLGGHGPEPVWREDALPGTPVLWLLAPAARQQGKTETEILLGTGNGVWRREAGGTWQNLPAVSAALRDRLPVSAVALDDDLVAVGDYAHGIVLFSPKADKVRPVIDRDAGLGDENVHTLRLDENGSLLAGLANGFARIAPPAAISFFDRRNGLDDIPLSVLLPQGDDVLAVTPRRVFQIAAATPENSRPATLVPLPAIASMIRDTARLPGQTFAGGFGGIWRLADGETTWHRERFVSTDVFCLAPSRRRDGWLFFAEGLAIKALEHSPRGWATRDLGHTIDDTPTSMVEDAEGDLWVATMARGVFRFRLQETPAPALRPPVLRLVARYRPGAGLPADAGRPLLTLAHGRVFAFTARGILGVRQPSGGFEPVPELENWQGIGAPSGADGEPVYWLAARRDIANAPPALLRIETGMTNGAFRVTPLALTELSVAGRPTTIGFAGGALWVGGTQGLLRLDPATLHRPSPPPPPRIWLRGVDVYSPDNDSAGATVRQPLPPPRLADGPGAARPAFPARAGTLGFDFAADAGGAEVFFQTRLSGAETGWTPPVRNPRRELSGLAPGTWTLSARAMDNLGRTSDPVDYTFIRLAPWYLGMPALATWACAAAGLVYVLVRLRLRRLRRANEQLNRIVEERTRELAMANTAKTEFLTTISHEIRNPLNGIVGLVSLLQETVPSGREHELARSLGSCVRSLTRVFEEVLGFSRLEHGQVGVQENDFTLAALLDEVVRVFSVTAGQRGNMLKLILPGEAHLRLHADDGKIKTIVNNFVANALKYAPGTAVEIEASLGPPEAGLRMLQIEVTDHGRGVAPEEQELIFRKFVRGSSARERHEDGAGLGLATCKALAGLMGGGVGIESERGKGATFYLQVPVVEAESPNEELPAVARASHPPLWPGSPAPVSGRRFAPSAGETPAPLQGPLRNSSSSFSISPQGGSGRALIVEDQEYNRIVMQRIAERIGYTTATAADAPAALARFAEGGFTVVFIDWDLPGMKGSDLARTLRARPRGDEPVILAVTAHDSDDIRQRCLAAGMDGFLLKPFDEELVNATLADARKRRAGAGGSNGLNFGIFGYVGRDDPRLTSEAVDDYLRLLDHELAGIARALAAHDTSAAARHAHRLRSHAGLLRARALNDAAGALERAASTRADSGQLEKLHGILLGRAATLREEIRLFKTSAGGCG